jgi:hypothetical protein
MSDTWVWQVRLLQVRVYRCHSQLTQPAGDKLSVGMPQDQITLINDHVDMQGASGQNRSVTVAENGAKQRTEIVNNNSGDNKHMQGSSEQRAALLLTHLHGPRVQQRLQLRHVFELGVALVIGVDKVLDLSLAKKGKKKAAYTATAAVKVQKLLFLSLEEGRESTAV